ncbi:MAG: methyltransferase domain-containing protein [Deltaproteobacteria bacterium]|nr:MAG: methyltransferase domain-containing protein [Deltaproteobacteria bacterium]
MKRSLEKEMMDLPGNPRELLEKDLRNLRIINRYLGAYHGLLGHLRRFVREGGIRSFSLLDMATGSSDIPVAVARWARGEGIGVSIIGLELDQVAIEAARRQTQSFPEISIVRANVFRPPFSPSSFDFIHASQLLHHFSEDEIVALLRAWSRIARRGILVSDLIRHPLAYCGIAVLTRLFTANEMTRTDAPLSVKRAFTVGEWRELFARAAIARVDVAPLFPFRVFASFHLEGSHEAV